MLGWQVLGAIDKVKVAIIMQGGLKAATNMTKKQRKERALKAAQTRWLKNKS